MRKMQWKGAWNPSSQITLVWKLQGWIQRSMVLMCELSRERDDGHPLPKCWLSDLLQTYQSKDRFGNCSQPYGQTECSHNCLLIVIMTIIWYDFWAFISSHLEGILGHVFQVIFLGSRLELIDCLNCLPFNVGALALYLDVWNLHLFNLRIFQMDNEFVNSAKFVRIYSTVLKAL